MNGIYQGLKFLAKSGLRACSTKHPYNKYRATAYMKLILDSTNLAVIWVSSLCQDKRRRKKQKEFAGTLWEVVQCDISPKRQTWSLPVNRASQVERTWLSIRNPCTCAASIFKARSEGLSIMDLWVDSYDLSIMNTDN